MGRTKVCTYSILHCGEGNIKYKNIIEDSSKLSVVSQLCGQVAKNNRLLAKLRDVMGHI